jgi:CcmD family protein
MQRKIISTVFSGLLSLPLTQAQTTGGSDFMRSTGSIWVVTGVLVITLIGLFALLIRLGQRLTKIENHLNNKNNVR